MYRLCTLQSPLQVPNITLSIFFYDDNVSNTKVSQWCFPFLPVLKSSKKFLSPTTPKLVTDVLYPPPSLSGIKVGVRNTPCGGITTFDFMVSMWLGDKAAWLLASLIVSTTNGLVLTIPSTSTNNILSDSSSRLAPVNLLHIFRTPFPRNTSGWLLLSNLRVNFQNNFQIGVCKLFQLKRTWATSVNWKALHVLALISIFLCSNKIVMVYVGICDRECY